MSLPELSKMLHIIYKLFKKRVENDSNCKVKISLEQFALLEAMKSSDDEVIQKDMAEAMCKDKSVILRLIDSLEEKELVKRVVNPKDRRKYYIMTTKLGNKVIDDYTNTAVSLMMELQKGLSDADVDTFHKVVKQVKENAEFMYNPPNC